MRRINQIILTVREANLLATAANPHLHRLALILLDNLIEVQLRRKSETEFAIDQTYWFSGVRKHDHKRRRRVARHHAELLKLAVEQDWISSDDAKILDFAHRLRNKTYHEGHSDDETEIILGITLLFRFIYAKFPDLCLSGFTQISPHKPIPIEQAADDATGFAPLIVESGPADDHPLSWIGSNNEETWRARLDHSITYDHRLDVRPLLKRRMENLLDRIQHSLDFITERDDTDFNAVMAHRFTILTPFFSQNEIDGKTMTNPVTALNIYIAILPHEEELLDLDDAQERATRFHQIVNDHKHDPVLLQSFDLDAHYEAAEGVLGMSEADGITVFLETKTKLETLGNASTECASDLDAYVQHSIDLYRGK